VDFGLQPKGDSSMARTVSLPVAIAVRMILEGSLTQRGVIAPLKPEVYNPILNELATMNIRFVEEKY
jgi:saccharopine dehydrogenase-like NADP-dependent oxidoreductase